MALYALVAWGIAAAADLPAEVGVALIPALGLLKQLVGSQIGDLTTNAVNPFEGDQ